LGSGELQASNGGDKYDMPVSGSGGALEGTASASGIAEQAGDDEGGCLEVADEVDQDCLEARFGWPGDGSVVWRLLKGQTLASADDAGVYHDAVNTPVWTSDTYFTKGYQRLLRCHVQGEEVEVCIFGAGSRFVDELAAVVLADVADNHIGSKSCPGRLRRQR
jgi:hypothetical protein